MIDVHLVCDKCGKRTDDAVEYSRSRIWREVYAGESRVARDGDRRYILCPLCDEKAIPFLAREGGQ